MMDNVSLLKINDAVYLDNILELTDCFVSSVDPIKVFLFGSFADGSYTEESDYDFYIVVEDDRNIHDASVKAHKSIRNKMKRPVDIVVGKNSRFEKFLKPSILNHSLMIENEVVKNGILLFDSKK